MSAHMIVLPGGGYAQHVAYEGEPIVGPHSLGLARGAGETERWTDLAVPWIAEQAAVRASV
jgi:hypothetical protein